MSISHSFIWENLPERGSRCWDIAASRCTALEEQTQDLLWAQEIQVPLSVLPGPQPQTQTCGFQARRLRRLGYSLLKTLCRLKPTQEKPHSLATAEFSLTCHGLSTAARDPGGDRWHSWRRVILAKLIDKGIKSKACGQGAGEASLWYRNLGQKLQGCDHCRPRGVTAQGS